MVDQHPDVRPPADDAETDEWFRAEALGFGGRVDADWMAGERTVLARERMLGVWEDSTCVATSGAYPFELSVPGGGLVPAAGVCDVAVVANRRRRGLLAAMLHRLHDDARARGDVAAILTASDGSIYPRFGYGVAASVVTWTLDAHRATLRQPPVADGEIELVLGTDAAPALAEAWVRLRGGRAGWLSRSEDWWRIVVGPKEQWKGGGDVHTLLLTDATGTVTGAAVHRIHFDVDRGVQNWRVEVLDLFGADGEVEARLWQELCRLDHVSTVSVRVGPVDEALRWRLVDPRQMKVSAVVDLLWVCPLDIPALLSARTYPAPGSVVLGVSDDFDPVNAGTYRLDGGPDGADCTRVEGVEPDLGLSSSEVGMLALGGTTPSVLAAAGRIVERTPGALARADALFPAARAPFCSTFF